MADCGDVVRHALGIPAVQVSVLVPNLRYAQFAFDAGVHALTIPVSVSEPHSISNIRKTHDEILEDVRAIVALRDAEYHGTRVEIGLATAFGCTIQGVVPEDDVVRMALRVIDCGVDAIHPADTVGFAGPAQVRRLLRRLLDEVGEKCGALHLHDTRGQGLANVVAGLDVGIRTFDSSHAGLGGCPYAPGATGNIVTEDLVFLLESMGLRTGVDIETAGGGPIASRSRPTGGRSPWAPRTGRHPEGIRSRGCRRVSTTEHGRLPLTGVRVVEFSHVVMGPACGLVLADLGADVVKVEPPIGDKTRTLGAASAGVFTTYSRNKRSVAVDVRTPAGLAFAKRLVAKSDVLIENFRPGSLDAVGLGHDALSAELPRLVYCSLKGFLSGPYEQRVALDEVVQMMGGLAYMTGPPGQPLRAGASVNDVMGAVFAVVGIVSALYERERTGRGKLVKSGLFENCAFLVAQHMARFAITGVEPRPMPLREPGWGIYDIFETSDGEQVFLAVVTDTQWRTFCAAFAMSELGEMETLATNRLRVEARDWLLPELRRCPEASHARGDLRRLRGGRCRVRSDSGAARALR